MTKALASEALAAGQSWVLLKSLTEEILFCQSASKSFHSVSNYRFHKLGNRWTKENGQTDRRTDGRPENTISPPASYFDLVEAFFSAALVLIYLQS